jgi:endonuclease-3
MRFSRPGSEDDAREVGLAVRTAEGAQKELKRKVARLARILADRYGPHIYPEERSTLLEQVLFALLAAENPVTNARKAIRDFKDDYVDWNEVRVSSIRELEDTLGKSRIERAGETAALLKSVLDRMFQDLCRVEIEQLKLEGAEKARKFVARLEMLKPHEQQYALLAAGYEAAPPLDPATERVCERLGVFGADDPPARRRRLLEGALESAGEAVRFYHLMTEHGKKLCTAEEPRCAKCLLQTDCEYFRGAEQRKRQAAKAAGRATVGGAKRAAPAKKAKAAPKPAARRDRGGEDE